MRSLALRRSTPPPLPGRAVQAGGSDQLRVPGVLPEGHSGGLHQGGKLPPVDRDGDGHQDRGVRGVTSNVHNNEDNDTNKMCHICQCQNSYLDPYQ